METITTLNNRVKRWERKFFDEYIRDGRFKPYMGTSPFSMIQLKDATAVGDKLSITLINRLRGAGVTGRNVLEGNEEVMDQRTFEFEVAKLRHAVQHDTFDEDISAIDLAEAEESVLKNWAMERMRDDIIAELFSINGVAYASADEAGKDAWLADNADRVQFGAAVANNSANDHSASLANIDNTADKFGYSALKMMKRRAKNADPKIRPIKVEGDEEWYVVFAGSRNFRDFSDDPVVQQQNREAWQRGQDNPLFTGGDLIVDGCIVREVPDIGVLAGVGAGGIDVGPVALCGAQAVGICWKQRTKMIQNVRDYGDKKGIGVKEIRDVAKLLFGKGTGDRDDLVDHGVYTGYFAAVEDA